MDIGDTASPGAALAPGRSGQLRGWSGKATALRQKLECLKWGRGQRPCAPDPTNVP